VFAAAQLAVSGLALRPAPTGPGWEAAVDVTQGLQSLLAVFLVAAVTPVPSAALPGPRIPQVVFFLIGGVIIGPHALGVADTANVQLVANVGLGFLFLLAGYEFDPVLLRQRPGRLAIAGWAVSVVLSVGTVAGLTEAGFVRDYVPIGLALTTTALGTLLPILHDSGMLAGDFGRYVFAAGAVGELFPIVAIAVFLTQGSHFAALLSVAAVGLLALALSAVPFITRSERLRAIVREGQNATGQVMLRWSVVLLFALLVIAAKFGQDVVLGAMLAGIVLRGWTRRMGIDVNGLEDKFDAVGYGVFIPVFFVSSGMTLDIAGIAQNPLRLIVFFLLLLVIRGLPSLVIYRRVLPLRQRAEMTFITATAMPLLVAIAEIGLRDGKMLPANAAALVGAGVLSVLVFPAVATALARKDRARTAPPEAEAAEVAAAEEVPRARHPADGLMPWHR
jgi:Kef-type K+ transport system membrane component KefB